MTAQYLLFRVDDRLLHGQVALGWGARLRPRAYVLADDRLAADPAAAALYESAAPDGVSVVILSVAALTAALEDPAARARLPRTEESILLVRTLAAGVTLVRAGVSGPLVLGGLHFKDGAREVLPYAFLSAADAEVVEALAREGRELVAHDLPGNERVGAERLREAVRRVFGTSATDAA